MDDNNEKANYSDDNDINSTQYIIAANLSKNSFMHVLIT